MILWAPTLSPGYLRLLGPCYTDPEVLKETEGTQLAGQMELLEVSL